ncbi:hypothetical protein BJF78_25940 [Pseudonocardia sp. CNS-139]|nr:hypothetical protein BJF78_25940 [Pseudonocardia sp. CNS-139]
MAQRYGPLVVDVLRRGGRPACLALVRDGKRGLEMVLQLPDLRTPRRRWRRRTRCRSGPARPRPPVPTGSTGSGAGAGRCWSGPGSSPCSS